MSAKEQGGANHKFTKHRKAWDHANADVVHIDKFLEKGFDKDESGGMGVKRSDAGFRIHEDGHLGPTVPSEAIASCPTEIEGEKASAKMLPQTNPRGQSLPESHVLSDDGKENRLNLSAESSTSRKDNQLSLLRKRHQKAIKQHGNKPRKR